MTTFQEYLSAKGLTEREKEVAGLVAKGMSNKEVGNEIFLLEKTIKFHLTKIYKKLGLKKRTELIFLYARGEYEI